jgi:hypothetical protein
LENPAKVEHLFALLGDPENYSQVMVREIPNSVILESKERIPALCFIEPTTPYFGFHEARSKTATSELSEYASTCNINTDELWNGNLRAISPELSGWSGKDRAFAIASFNQGGLNFGLLESALRTRVDDTYLVCIHPDFDRPFIYSRALLCWLHDEVFARSIHRNDTLLLAISLAS